MSSRLSNAERARWRLECREVLAKHINETLKLAIEPSEVRLIPGENDPYEWDIVEGKEHLFEKQLSKHSVGPLLELIREVGVSFEAVLRTKSAVRSEAPLTLSEVRRIQSENTALVEQVRSLKSQAKTAESKMKQMALAFRALKRRDAKMKALAGLKSRPT